MYRVRGKSHVFSSVSTALRSPPYLQDPARRVKFSSTSWRKSIQQLTQVSRSLSQLLIQLDPRTISSHHIQLTAMQLSGFSRSTLLALLFFAACAAAHAQQSAPPKETPAPAPIPRLAIEITGGDENKPIENASVYLKTQEDHLIKDKKTEVNVKTNMQGIAHVPQPPIGRVLIQVVAEGWKPYGHWYDIADSKQVVKIHLDRPPKWY
jgi:hypothetical protein